MSELKVTHTLINDFEAHIVWRKLLEDFNLAKASAMAGLLDEELSENELRQLQREVNTISRLLDYPNLLREELQLQEKHNE